MKLQRHRTTEISVLTLPSHDKHLFFLSFDRPRVRVCTTMSSWLKFRFSTEHVAQSWRDARLRDNTRSSSIPSGHVVRFGTPKYITQKKKQNVITSRIQYFYTICLLLNPTSISKCLLVISYWNIFLSFCYRFPEHTVPILNRLAVCLHLSFYHQYPSQFEKNLCLYSCNCLYSTHTQTAMHTASVTKLYWSPIPHTTDTNTSK